MITDVMFQELKEKRLFPELDSKERNSGTVASTISINVCILVWLRRDFKDPEHLSV